MIPSALRTLFLALSVFTLLLPAAAAEEEPKELTLIFQKQKDPARMREEADRVADYLGEQIGIPVRASVPGSYAASVQALVSKKADLAYVDSLSFLLARRDGGAKVLLAEERKDASGDIRTEYDSIFVVRKESPLKNFDDLQKQSQSLRMVFTSPTSTSGYVMPYRRFVKAGMLQRGENPKKIFQQVSFGGSYAQALEEVLLGRADVAAVSYYTLEGDKANNYLPEEKREKLRILARTPGVPTHVIAVRSGLSEKLAKKAEDAILKLAEKEPELLNDVYGTARFTEVNEDQHVKASAEAVEYLNLPIEGFVMKKKSS